MARAYKLARCPRCSGECLVRRSEETAQGIVRCKTCTRCPTRFVTLETIIGTEGARKRPGGPISSALVLEMLSLAGVDLDRLD